MVDFDRISRCEKLEATIEELAKYFVGLFRSQQSGVKEDAAAL